MVDESYFNGKNTVVKKSHKFINAVVKIQSGNCLHLDKDEEVEVENLLKCEKNVQIKVRPKSKLCSLCSQSLL